MAMRDRKMEGSFGNGQRGRELTHREDFARNGDYLGRLPGDVSGRNHFDEEYFVDESENGHEMEMPVKNGPAKPY